MVVALLGVLKTGGCYVPLDAQYPVERISFMIKDAGLDSAIDDACVGPVAESGRQRNGGRLR